MNFLKSFVGGCLVAFGLATHAAPVTIQTFDNGWYTSTGVHTPSNTNVYTGFLGNSTRYYGFFAFDLGSLVGQTIVSGTLRFYANNGANVGLGTKELYITDFGGDIDLLLAGLGGTAAASDLSTGFLLTAAKFVTQPNPSGSSLMPQLDLAMNTAGINELNATLADSDHRVVFGSQLWENYMGFDSALWSGSDASVAAELIIVLAEPPSTVPEPGTMLLAGIALLAITAQRRKRAH